MKTFRTVFPTYSAPFTITHADRLLLIGSCFTEHIGARLETGKFTTLVNPNGIVYNPVSIARTLSFLLWERPDSSGLIRPNHERIENSLYGSISEHNDERIDPELSGRSHNNLVEYHGLWHSWEHHGVFSKPDRQATEDGIRLAQQQAAGFLQKTDYLLLTLGTAEVFSLRETGQVVANCHKAPASWFEQRRLTVSETVQALSDVLSQIKAKFPEIRVILTVSPVRHLRNGFVENQRSKAVLTLACAELCEQFDYLHYFPAYELLLDDLRDYRFYTADMIHPNEQAVDYIWQYFSETFFTPETQRLLDQIGKIAAAARHRPFNPDTAEHRAFARAQLEKIEGLVKENPGLRFEAERAIFEQII